MVCRACSQRTLTTLFATLGLALASLIVFNHEILQKVSLLLCPALQHLLSSWASFVIMLELNRWSILFFGLHVKPPAGDAILALITSFATFAFACVVIAFAIIALVVFVVIGVSLPLVATLFTVAFEATTLVAFAFAFAVFPFCSVLWGIFLHSLDGWQWRTPAT